MLAEFRGKYQDKLLAFPPGKMRLQVLRLTDTNGRRNRGWHGSQEVPEKQENNDPRLNISGHAILYYEAAPW